MGDFSFLYFFTKGLHHTGGNYPVIVFGTKALKLQLRLIARNNTVFYRSCNLWEQNNVYVTSALFILRIHFTQTLCEEGARDVNNIWVPEIICLQQELKIKVCLSEHGILEYRNSSDLTIEPA